MADNHSAREPLRLKVKAVDAGMRLDRWIKAHHSMPHSLLQKLLRKGAIRVDGKRAKIDTRLEAGQEIKLPDVESNAASQHSGVRPVSEKEAKEWLQKHLLWEDKNFLAVNKPSGLAVQGGSKVTKAVDTLLHVLPGYDGVRLTHRLDKDTTGVVLLAKHAKAAQLATKAFKHKAFEKRYIAVVVGVPELKQGTIDAPLAIQGEDGRNEKTQVDADAGRPAISHYRVLDAAGKVTCVLELVPETGRKHQLRVHLLAIGCPVLGDGKYGGSDAFIEGTAKQLHLHAAGLRYSGNEGMLKTVGIDAPLPKHMQETLEFLGLEVG